MRNDMYEGLWSPFDPKWYQEAFDKFISTADQLFNQDLIIQQGYHIPDADGSRSSVFRNDAVLNNSFNEKKLRETLKDIYFNSSHKLVASNHDNTHFFQWHGHMSDMSIIPNTSYCEFKIPTETFIGSKERDSYKLSQFYRKWIKVEDILNNWNIFKWHCLLLIDQKINSEYEFHIDDHEVTIRFKYYDYWLKMNHSVYLYKFDTNSQCRVLISRELCENQWNWKVPVSYISDKRVANATNIIVAFNKISDQEIRKDGLTRIEVLGDNLEFLKIEDGFIDLSKISKFNKNYIHSEMTEWLWMSIIVPKFFHEYPILLPTDVIYRPYEAKLHPVSTMKYDRVQHVKTYLDDESNYQKQVYVDLNEDLRESHNVWKQMIRPIVLSDAFDNSNTEMYDKFTGELDNLRDLTVKGADIIEEFRFFVQDYTTDEKFNQYLDDLVEIMSNIREAYNAFLDKRLIDHNEDYEDKYTKFTEVIKIIREEGVNSEWLNSYQGSETDFWLTVSPLIYIPRELADKYMVIEIIKDMGENNRILWTDVNQFMNQIRFQRPIDEQDFWTFEYYPDDEVWRPYPLEISRHFPDVYLPKDTTEVEPSLNRIFKTFFFYSDTMNVLNESSEIVRATPDWDKDVNEYHFDQGAVYRDIFMEKFYWMGVRAIYKGLLLTQCRWEALEYVIDNASYERFNELFLQTMDPYFKLGLATYLKSSNFEFPFDDAVAKMEESINNKWLGYKRVTNFEVYLNKTWIPSYFDYITKIMDNWDYENRLLKRPRNSFDILRLLPMMIDIQTTVFKVVKSINDDIDWLLERLSIENYNLNVQTIKDLNTLAKEMFDNIDEVLTFTKDLDLQIYSIDDINHIIDRLRKHVEMIDVIKQQFTLIYEDASANNVYENKRTLLLSVSESIDEFPEYISKISGMVQMFDMDGFMKAINDLRSYFDHAKTNPDDNSLIGHINKFDDPWSQKVKDCRNKLFSSTAVLYGNYEPLKSYTNEEVEEFTSMVDQVKCDIKNLRDAITEFWENFNYDPDQVIIDGLDHTETLLSNLTISVGQYIYARGDLVNVIKSLDESFKNFDQFNISSTENEYRNNIISGIGRILTALSYIAGKNNREDALEGLNDVKREMTKWVQFINTEESVFVKLFEFSEEPIEFIDTLHSNQEILDSMVEYMDTVNIPFVPDTSWPTYADIYEVESVELLSGGFYHNIGDMVYIPTLGSYKITSISGNVSVATAIEDSGYRCTNFRDLMCQSNPFDAITDGSGMGITVKPVSSKHTRIINDQVVTSFITRIESLIYMISSNVKSFNSYANTDLFGLLTSIHELKRDWNKVLNIYTDYMSSEVRDYVNNIINELSNIITVAETFANSRSEIDVKTLLVNFKKFIFDSYRYTEEIEVQDQNFFYYDEKIRTAYEVLLNFYDDGASWSDGEYLKSILDETKFPINFYYSKVLSQLPEDTKLDDINAMYNELIIEIDSLKSAITNIPNVLVDVSPIIRQVENKLENIPDIHKDVWYKIKNIGIADDGKNYQVGDIIEIVPELPVDTEGNPITDAENIIMNDVILLQVTAVEDGHVVKVQSFMDYAIPYKIWGIHDTKTRVGNGFGLRVDVYSYELEITDTTLFTDANSDISQLPQFNQNDMFMFKFENIHDLDIGYEVFLGGKQITNFFQRHESDNDPLHPKNIDILYINANAIMDLRNSSVFVPAEHYFIYKIDKIEVKDPGAGYSVGQDIFVDTDQLALRLKVAKLVYSPYKEIAEVDIGSGGILYRGTDPTCENASVVTDSLNNIDDEFNVGYYDKLTKKGITKPSTLSFDEDTFKFESRRFDDLTDGDRNKTFMYPDVDMPNVEDAAINGDPDYHWYLGSRINNSQHPMTDERIWNGISNTIPPTHPFIPDDKRVPTGKPIKGEYQLFKRLRIHNSEGIENDDVTSKFEDSVKNSAMIEGDFVVPDFAHLPRHTNDYPDGCVGKRVIVECDETNEGHRMLYRIRTFVAAGFFVYDLPEIADLKWNTVNVDWMNADWYQDYPSMVTQYPDAPWSTGISHRDIQEGINDGKYEKTYDPVQVNTSAYIHQVTVDDISVFNWTTKQWEDLHDESRWKLEVREDDPENKDWGFTLTFLQEGAYSYDMAFYWNKIPDTQTRNASLKKNAVLDIAAVVVGEVNTPAINTSVYTGRHLRIRKLFPYEQKESYTIGKSAEGDPLGYEMNFKLAPYIHFKNEIHLEDIKVFNKTAGRFENVLDPKMFEVQFKDPKAVNRGFETQTRIVQSIIGKAGTGFADGNVWAWNDELGISLLGYVTADVETDGHLLSFKAIHCPNPPKESIALEFNVFQHVSQSEVQMAIVMVEFKCERLEIYGDGYIHNVTNPLAPVPNEFKLITQYNLDGPGEYDIIISKRHQSWSFVEPKWLSTPTFHLPDCNIQQDRLYVLTDNGRFPLVNPSTGKPTLKVLEGENGTDVTFLNLYRRYEHLEIRAVPYPMRSVYVQRRIPKSGYIDLGGKINKPLNKKYFEFWVNGKLLFDEVTIITPTKIFLHGLKSLKNLEIIEVNRDPNEYFSDVFSEVEQSDLNRPFQKWNYRTYLDDALEGNLEGDNYTNEEQEYLLSPVWKQVSEDHPEFKNYPPNCDIEDDVLIRVTEEDRFISDLDSSSYQFMIVDAPTLEGHPITERGMSFEHFGFIPISDSMIVKLLNEEWAEEIAKDPYFPEHAVMTDEEWYGMAARLYDEYGILVHNLNEAAYKVADTNLLMINVNTKMSRIVKNHITYDLT